MSPWPISSCLEWVDTKKFYLVLSLKFMNYKDSFPGTKVIVKVKGQINNR